MRGRTSDRASCRALWGATVESVYDAVELRPYDRSMNPAKPIDVKSSYLEAFEGSGFDSALLTEDVEHEWLSRKPVPPPPGARRA